MSRPTRQAAYAIDGAPVSTTAFYARACDPARSVVVEACAGAGKTWMLVSRILRALLDGAEPHEILAITFTKKAAGEMRARLAEWLAEFAAKDAGHRTQALIDRGLDAKAAAAVQERLGALHDTVLAGGRGVAVRTFHSWFTQLMKAAPMALLAELGLHAGMDLVEDTGDYAQALWRRFLRAVQADPALRADFDTEARQRGRYVLEGWAARVREKSVEIELADRAGVFASSVGDATVAWPAFDSGPRPGEVCTLLRRAPLAAWLESVRPALAAGGKKARDAAQAMVTALALPAHETAFEALWQALFTKQGTPRALGKIAGLEAVTDALEAIAVTRRQQAAHEEHLRLVRLARVLLNEWRQLKRERNVADMTDLERVAMHLLRDAPLAAWVHERLDTRVRHLLIDEFQDTSPLQWQALEAWLSGYAGAGGGASGQRPPSVFIVGDPKQSIYRFRRAEPRVFEAAKAFVRDGLGGAVLSCDHTRRNAPEVIEAINRTFLALGEAYPGFRVHTTHAGASPLAPALRALPETWRPKKGSQGGDAAGEEGDAKDDVGGTGPSADARAGEPGSVGARGETRGERATRLDAHDEGEPVKPGVWRDSLNTPRIEPEEALRQQEARHIAAAIAERVAAGQDAGEILVLARTRARLRTVAEALRDRQLPCVEPEAADLAATAEGADLLALLDVLASPQHDLALARVLRSPLFEAGDDELIALALAVHARRDTRQAATWWQVLCEPRPEEAAALEGRAALARARRLLPAWRDAARRLPPHDLLQHIVASGEVRERYAAVVPPAVRALALDRIDGLLHGALALDQGRYASIYSFVRALRQRGLKRPPPVPQGAVQLLTVHGAKGLEAEVVFVMDSDPEQINAWGLDVLVQWPAHAAAPQTCAFVPAGAGAVPSMVALQAEEAEAQAREELNGLYVAMTRAKQLLVLSRTQPHRASQRGPSWWQCVGVAQPAAWVPGAGAGEAAGAEEGASGAVLRDASAASPDPAADAVVLKVLSPGPGIRAGLGGHPGVAGGDDDLTSPPRLTSRRPVAPGAVSRPEADDPRQAALGQAVHRILEWLTVLPVADRVDETLQAAARAAAAEAGLEAAAATSAAAIAARVLHSPACARWLDPAQCSWAGNEVPMPGAGEAQRIDRLVAFDEAGVRTWWVLDYKLQHAPGSLPAYRDQLKRYVAAVQAAQPGEPVRAAFITGAGEIVPAD